MPRWQITVFVGAVLLVGRPAWAELDSVQLRRNLQLLQQIGPKGEGHPSAVTAWKTLSGASPGQLTAILAAMNDENPLANNWIRAAVDTVAERAVRRGDPLPLGALTDFLANTSHSPRSRWLAFEWVTRVDPAARRRLVRSFLHDPSLELRREAVAAKLHEGDLAVQLKSKDEAIAIYRTAFDAARDLDQIQTLTEKLRQLGETVDLPSHFGFIMTWDLIGPFDNTNTMGFERAYPPEQQIDLAARYDGKEGSISWKRHTTQDDFGMVDLNQALGKHKGAAAYALAFIESETARRVELRLGCINASKIWLNGELLAANDVYHSGTSVDQYVAPGELRPGKNVILLKICQNEQTESWAQEWEFQLRVCDALGTAVRSAE
jgi:hypothetical protein